MSADPTEPAHTPALPRRQALAGAAGLLLLAGCGSQSVPSDSYYRLAPPGDVPTRAGGPLPGAVEVPPFRAEGLLNDRAIMFRAGASGIAQYTYHFWWKAPTEMLQSSLVDALRRANAFTRVETPELRLDRTYEILGRIRQLEKDGNTAVVELELMLRAVRSGTPLLLKTYSRETAAADTTIPAVVAAFSSGLSAIWAEFIGDLGGVNPGPAA